MVRSADTSELGELTSPEVATRELWMGDHEPIRRDRLSFVQHDVEVERARAPALLTHTASVSLDRLERITQLVGREVGFKRRHLIQKRRLLHRPDRRGFLDRRYCSQAGGGQ